MRSASSATRRHDGRHRRRAGVTDRCSPPLRTKAALFAEVMTKPLLQFIDEWTRRWTAGWTGSHRARVGL